MTDRATIFQGIQLGVESTNGANAAADKQLLSLTLEPTIELETNTYKPTGHKYPTIVVPNKEWTSAKLGGPLTYGEIVYLLSSVLVTPTPARNIAVLVAPAAPTSALAGDGAGLLSNGLYKYKVTLVNAIGETEASAANVGTTVADKTSNGKIALTAIPVGATGTTARKIYRTEAAGSTYKLLTTIADNTTVVFADNIADATLGAAAPAVNTTQGVSFTWTFNPAQAAADTVTSFTVEQGDSTRAHKFNYGLLTDLGIDFSRAEITLDGTMIGQQLQDDITLTATPSAIEVVPVLPDDGNLYLADTQAGLAGASALDRGFSFSFKVGSRFGPIWPIKSAATSFDAHVETEPSVECSLMMEADDTGMGLLTQMRAGSTKWLRIKYVGATIESTYTYKFQIDIPLKVTKVASLGDSDGVYGIEYTMVPAYNAVWGHPFEVVVVNQVRAL